MKKNYLMEIIREEISSYLGENESMYDSPQTQQREVYSMLDQVENLKRLRADLDEQIAQLEAIANTFNVNEDAAANKAATDAQRMAIDKKIAALNKTKQELSKPGVALEEEQLDEETLNEMPFIGGEKGAELFNAIKTASEKLKNQFPDATPEDISKIIKNKKTQTKFAPEVEDALIAQEKKYGGDPNYTANLGPNQTLKAVAKALGEYEPGPRGRKAKEKGEAESKSGKDVPNKLGRKAKSTPATKTEKPAAEPKSTPAEPVDKEDAAALKAAANVKGGALTAGEKYGKLKAALDAKTAELKALAGSPDMEKRKALTAEKMRIEAAIEKLKQVKM